MPMPVRAVADEGVHHAVKHRAAGALLDGNATRAVIGRKICKVEQELCSVALLSTT